jgi:hypothetical protein
MNEAVGPGYKTMPHDDQPFRPSNQTKESEKKLPKLDQV